MDDNGGRDDGPNDAGYDGGPFWRFSLAFYARPQAAAALIRLQDQAGCSVNLILYALWLGWSGRPRLDPPGLATAIAAMRPIDDAITAPLRRLRRNLKPVAAADVQILRDRVKELELAAEKAVQARLAALAGPPAVKSPVQRQSAAAANLALCLDGRRGFGAETDTLCRLLGDFCGDA